MEEIWRDIPGYEGLYMVSNMGRIKTSKGYIMAQKQSKDGYIRLQLFKCGKYKSEYVHILVAKTFIPNPDNKPEINHVDADKANNAVSNLEWVTKSENHHHAVKMGLKPVCPTIGKHGSANPCAKPLYQYDLSGNLIKMWGSNFEAAEAFNCPLSSIRRAVYGVRKTYKGFIWSYKELGK